MGRERELLPHLCFVLSRAIFHEGRSARMVSPCWSVDAFLSGIIVPSTHQVGGFSFLRAQGHHDRCEMGVGRRVSSFWCFSRVHDLHRSFPQDEGCAERNWGAFAALQTGHYVLCRADRDPIGGEGILHPGAGVGDSDAHVGA